MIRETRHNYGYVSRLNHIHIRVNLPKAFDPRSRIWLMFCLTLNQFHIRVNLPKAYDPRSRTWLRFCLTLNQFHIRVNLPKACNPKSQTWLRFCLTLNQFHIRVNLPKACNSKSRTGPRFCLTLNQVHIRQGVMNNFGKTEHQTTSKELNGIQSIINNNIYIDYLHSRDVEQHSYPNLLGNKPQSQLLMLYDMDLPS